MVYVAANNHNDIRGKTVIDLGCGTGVLAIGAALMGAKHVVGVDIDDDAIAVAVRNAEAAGVDVEFVTGSIGCVGGKSDVVLMNPPFGAWKRGADVHFLDKALEIAAVTYSLHKRSESSREFLTHRIAQLGGRVDRVYEMTILIPRMFDFHRHERYYVKADLYRTVKRRNRMK
ncbi:MAG: METTL5 family protein [Candidatus Bathyarchaeia archaeon]